MKHRIRHQAKRRAKAKAYRSGKQTKRDNPAARGHKTYNSSHSLTMRLCRGGR